MRIDPVLLHPIVTEKTMMFMETRNSLEFVVRSSATKPEIKKAFEALYDVKVEKVNVLRKPDGKHAIIKLKKGYSAEDISMRIGMF